MLTFSQKYTSDEMEAAHALLALSNSAPNAPPVHKTADSSKSGPNVHPSSVETERKLPKTPEPSHQAPLLNTVSQVSPLTELDCFVAAAVTDGEQRYVYSHYNSSHDVSLNYFQATGCSLCACLVNIVSVSRFLFACIHSVWLIRVMIKIKWRLLRAFWPPDAHEDFLNDSEELICLQYGQKRTP